MARRLKFTKDESGGLVTYRHIRESRLVERSWPGLWDHRWPEREPTPFSEWAVNNNNGEEVAVYLGLIWRLTEGRRRFVVPRWDREAGMYAAGAPYALIDWEHEVEDFDEGETGRIRGFVPARTSVRILPEAGPWERENGHRAGLFDVAAFAQLKDIVRGLLCDATGELNLYALTKQPSRPLPPIETLIAAGGIERLADVRGETLAAALMSSQTPEMVSLLQPGEIFVDLTIGVDHGYADVLVIQALDDLDDKLTPLLDEYDEAIVAYEADVDALASFEEFNNRLGRLIGIAPPSQRFD